MLPSEKAFHACVPIGCGGGAAAGAKSSLRKTSPTRMHTVVTMVLKKGSEVIEGFGGGSVGADGGTGMPRFLSSMVFKKSSWLIAHPLC